MSVAMSAEVVPKTDRTLRLAKFKLAFATWYRAKVSLHLLWDLELYHIYYNYILSRIHFYTDWNMVMQWHNTKMQSLLRVLRSCSPSNVIAIANTPISAATSETCGLDIYYILDGSSSTGVQMYELIKGVSGCIVGLLNCEFRF